MRMWAGKRYYSLDAWCKEVYGEKLYKIAINAGFTCPTRDGRAGTKGCIFCSAQGSGDFAVPLASPQAATIRPQIEDGLQLFHEKKIVPVSSDIFRLLPIRMVLFPIWKPSTARLWIPPKLPAFPLLHDQTLFLLKFWSCLPG